MDVPQFITDCQEGLFDEFFVLLLGRKPAYQPEDLVTIEAYIKHIHPEHKIKPDSLNTSILPCGFYFGETMVRNLTGARWTFTDETLSGVAVEVPSDDHNPYLLLPFSRAANAIEDPLKRFSDMYGFLNAANLKFVNLKRNQGWVRTPNGQSQYRTVSVRIKTRDN